MSTPGRILTKFYLPLVLLLSAALAWKPLFGGVDFWAHAAIGRWIWQHQSVPHETLFLWGQQPPLHWIYHSWLSQLAFYGLMKVGGENGGPMLAVLILCLIVAVSFYLIWCLWQSRAGINVLTPFLFVFAIWCASARFNPRPEMFSALFLSVLLVYLARRSDKETTQSTLRETMSGEKWPILGIAALFTLWANFHGGVALGLLMLGLYAVCEWLQTRHTPRSWTAGVLLLVAILAVNLNPYGFEYWQALKPVGGEMFSLIDEWKPLWREPALPPVALGFLGVLWGLALWAWLKNPQRRWAELAWLLVMTFFLLSARRHLWSFSQVCLIVIAANSTAFDAKGWWLKWSRRESIAPGLQVIARAGAVTCLVLTLLVSLPTLLRATSPTLPEQATQFVQNRDLRGRFFVDYLHTSYWQWRFGGEPAVYIDLLNAYQDHLLGDYFEIISASPDGLKKLQALQPDYIFFGAYEPDSRLAPLAEYLNGSQQWRVLYQQEDGTLWHNLRDESKAQR